LLLCQIDIEQNLSMRVYESMDLESRIINKKKLKIKKNNNNCFLIGMLHTQCGTWTHDLTLLLVTKGGSTIWAKAHWYLLEFSGKNKGYALQDGWGKICAMKDWNSGFQGFKRYRKGSDLWF
jgi:hypothetical protein